MKRYNKQNRNCQSRINQVVPTDEKITGRGGLSLFAEYIQNVNILSCLSRMFGGLRKSSKGLPVNEIFKQLFCFFMDGSSRHLDYFDHLARDPGYAGAIQTRQEAMASSHAIKRFLKSFSIAWVPLFRWLLLNLFIWRLHLNKPDVIILGIDLVIMDNDDAKKREQVRPTYKKVKGFGALNMTWGNLVVDSIFRPGDKHSNHGNSVQRMIKRAISTIRKRYRPDVPIIFRMDSGFMDQKLFDLCEKLGAGYTGSGKLYQEIIALMDEIPHGSWQHYFASKGVDKRQIWEYFEFGSRLKSWKKFRRTIFTRPMCNEIGQYYLPGVRPSQVIYTNLGMGGNVDKQLIESGHSGLMENEAIIGMHHGRGEDELIFRAFKEFGSEELPFKRFVPNAVYYYCMLLSFFLYQCFKEDVAAEVISPYAYPNTVRRELIDIGAKLVSHANSIILKIARAVWQRISFFDLWEKANSPPRISWA